jgi:hypothetical protein
MTPKQKTMSEICDILHEQAKAYGQGLDREMFTKTINRHTHKFLLMALRDLKNPTIAQRPGLLEAARLLRTDGVLLPIIVGETHHDHIIRFALAFADKLEELANPVDAQSKD